MRQRPLLLAVDGTGLLVRCSRAASARQSGHALATADGIPTAALTMFAGSLAKTVREVSPSHAVVAWDGPGALDWRRAACPGYKPGSGGFSLSGRESGQAAEFFCSAAGISQWSLPGFEADDLLAYAARSASRVIPEGDVILASEDADLLQVASYHVFVLQGGKRLDRIDVEGRWGVPPQHLAKLRALAGDRSDGIPGLPRVGIARAVAILRGCFYEWPPPGLEALQAGPGDVRELVSSWYRVMDLRDPEHRPESVIGPGEMNVADCAWNVPDIGKVLPVLEKYELRALAERAVKGYLW